eukprot:TRINITY_DN302_c0_g3_i2.p6 TRINITY_DN302_c0_g3~~TRINITY_DN302_c0_g3_i2.p6  ORF type:complete len:112 (-),score=7.51 TRINITY_DN302_c0_g3_i2:234-569(-)
MEKLCQNFLYTNLGDRGLACAFIYILIVLFDLLCNYKYLLNYHPRGGACALVQCIYFFELGENRKNQINKQVFKKSIIYICVKKDWEGGVKNKLLGSSRKRGLRVLSCCSL